MAGTATPTPEPPDATDGDIDRIEEPDAENAPLTPRQLIETAQERIAKAEGEFVDLLARLRSRPGLTVAQLAEATGKSATWIATQTKDKVPARADQPSLLDAPLEP